MILQCDQCQTKFRLDDSKLKPGGVKVRCSKCRHVFLAGAELKQEESEFDAILSGLGAPAAQKPTEAAPKEDAAAFGFDESPAAESEAPAPVASQPEMPEFAAFDFPADTFATPESRSPVPEEQPDLGAYDSAAEPPRQQALATNGAPGLEYGEFAFADEPPALQEETESAPGQSLDFGDFAFEEEPAAKTEESPPAAQGGGLDFGDFDFDATPIVKQQEPAASPDALEFGEFSFSEEPTVKSEEPPAAVDTLNFGELSFDEEPVLKHEEHPAATVDAMDFGDFSFDEEPAAKEEPQEPATVDAMDFGGFSFDEEPAAKDEPQQPAAVDAMDFGDFSFDEEPALKEQQPPAAVDAVEFGEFTFDEEPAVKDEQPPAAAADALDFGDFSFAEEPPHIQEEPATGAASDDFASFSFSEELPSKPCATAASGADFTLDDFSLSHDFSQKEPEPAPQPAAAGFFGAAGSAVPVDAERPEPIPAPVSPAANAEKPGTPEALLGFPFGAKTTESPLPDMDMFGEEEELPPLSISSRRKGRSVLAVSIVALCVVAVIALSGAGLYLMQSGPAALEKFDQLGIGFVGKWFGMVSPEEGRITVKNPVAAFHQNQSAGELFVVTGEAVNSYRKARASIHVKVSIFDKNGAVLLQKTAYCGNRLSDEQLATLPMEKIESIMNNQFGDSLSNLGVQPGQPIGFVVAFANVPKEAVDFGVEVIGSTVAGQ
jgi:predicted Zn finger-like uncharacterized protein